MFKATLLMAAANAIALERHHHHHSDDYVYLRSTGIPGGALMSGSHWRKAWPEGTDNGNDDDFVVNLKKDGIRGKNWLDAAPHIDYSTTLDSDVVDTQKHLDDIEGQFKESLSETGY